MMINRGEGFDNVNRFLTIQQTRQKSGVLRLQGRRKKRMLWMSVEKQEKMGRCEGVVGEKVGHGYISA